jgi:hypothetical protein
MLWCRPNQVEKEQFAYEVLLNKFDVMLKNLRTRQELPNQGLVIHDRRVIAEREIQSWTSGGGLRRRRRSDSALFQDAGDDFGGVVAVCGGDVQVGYQP